jgi:quercetin dioxygenase-like cupin family protein
MAKEYGLVLLEDGTLVDIAAGETVPTDKKIMPETTPEQVAALKSFTTSDLRASCIKAGEVVPLMPTDGIKTRALISQSSKLNWSHGFHITQYELETGSMTDICNFDNSDVVYVFDGELSVEVNDMTYSMHSGDTATISSGSARRFRNISERPVTFLRVQGNDA